MGFNGIAEATRFGEWYLKSLGTISEGDCGFNANLSSGVVQSRPSC